MTTPQRAQEQQQQQISAHRLLTYQSLSSDVSTYSADVSNVLHYNYVITRTWRATDVAGNFSQCVQTITVHDVTNPVIACPAAVTIDCEDDNTPAGTGTATATDVCTPVANITITFSDASTYSADPVKRSSL